MARALVRHTDALPRSLQLPGIGNTMGVPGNPPIQPKFLGSEATPLYDAWGAEIEVDHVINVSLAMAETPEHKDLDVDIGKDLFTFITTDTKLGPSVSHLLCYGKSLPKINLYLKTTEGRARFPTCSGEPILKTWRPWGVKESLERGPGVHNFHICQRARMADIWAWDGLPRHDGTFLWMVLLIMGPPGFEHELAKASAAEMDPAMRKMPPGCYWQWVPYNTPTASPPVASLYCNLHFIGHALYVGRMHQYLEGNPHARVNNAKLAKLACFPDQSKDQSIEALHQLPMIEVQLGLR
jgi:hypothetical protein